MTPLSNNAPLMPLEVATTRSIQLPWLACLVATLLSLLALNFYFGKNNNVFHIPYVLDLSADPQFAADKFYQSLQYFTSAVWPLLKLISNEGNVATVFLVAHIVSRAAAVIAIAWMLAILGVPNRHAIGLGVILLVLSPWLNGYSIIGQHGMLINYFTHTELTWPLVMASLGMMAIRRVLPAALFAGLVFTVNAFVGCWVLAILLFTALHGTVSASLTRLAWILGLFLLMAAPVGLWIAIALQQPGAAEDFDFREFIRSYYRPHFLIEGVQRRQLAELICIFTAGVASAIRLHDRGYWAKVVLGTGLLFVVGMVLPYWWNHRLVFNLHLLRIDGLLQFIVTLLVVAVALREYIQERGAGIVTPFLVLLAILAPNAVLAYLLVTLLFLLKPAMYAALIRFGRPADHVSLQRLTALVALAIWAAWSLCSIVLSPFEVFGVLFHITGFLCGAALFVLHPAAPLRAASWLLIVPMALVALFAHQRDLAYQKQLMRPDKRELAAIADWIKSHPLDGAVLLTGETVWEGSFQLRSRNPVWVDHKQGAAVMWSPAFHEQWGKRWREVRQLEGSTELVAYARLNKIRYLVKGRVMDCPNGTHLLTKQGMHVLCELTQTN